MEPVAAVSVDPHGESKIQDIPRYSEILQDIARYCMVQDGTSSSLSHILQFHLDIDDKSLLFGECVREFWVPVSWHMVQPRM